MLVALNHRPGLPERATSDYVRNRTTTLFAALEVATGKITDACFDRHRHTEFLRFLQQVAKAHPRRQLHVVLDNYGTPSIERCGRGWSATRASICTSPPPRGRG